MVYFSSAPVAPQSLDSEQFEKLKEFKKWCQDKGLVETYENVEDFRSKFATQLQIQVASNPYLSAVLDKSSSVSIEPMTPELSAEAKELLLAACEDHSGTIMSLRQMGGTFIQTNGKTFGGDTAREQARWEGALRDLIHNSYVLERGVKGEVFQVSDRGYALADKITTA